MPYDVVVVGGGVGGLTVAALLSARGLSVCLLERQSQVGGCIGRVEHSGYEFEPGMGLYPAFGPREIYDLIFSELPVTAPAASLVDSEYVVRLAGDSEVRLYKNDSSFFDELRRVFPECRQEAVEFYKLIGEASNKAVLDKPRRGLLSRIFGSSGSPNFQQAGSAPTLSFATNTSARFRRFIDAQLKAFLQTGIDRCAFASACKALTIPRRNLYSLEHGISELPERLADSIRKSGGVVRLNSPVLRLAYRETGDAIGVDLLNGETVLAQRAIVSNLTIWDTYGRLVGLQRTPPDIKNSLQQKQSSGAYVIYATVESATAAKLPEQNFLVSEPDGDETSSGEFTVSVRSGSSTEQLPATIKTATEVIPWFSFQTSEEDYEQRDQEALAQFWTRLHQSVPELGSGIEVIETANPRTYYDETRRKLGMVMGVESTPEAVASVSCLTPIQNVFMVGDTTGTLPMLDSVISSARMLADRLSK
jgi:phytoene dehydrogenase-like protein